jgi:hypothetical protein
MTKTYKFEIVVDEGGKGPQVYVPHSKYLRDRRTHVGLTKVTAEEEAHVESSESSDEGRPADKKKGNKSKNSDTAHESERETESIELVSSDSDTDECYEPLGLEPWR